MVRTYSSLKEAISSEFGPDCRIESRRGVSGGDINIASLLELNNGSHVFLKENKSELAPMFAAEALGLEAIADVTGRGDSPPVPKPIASGTDERRSFLLMEAIVPGDPSGGGSFGRSLAVMHREGRSDRSGFDADNWIGSTPQINVFTESWHDFFAEYRLLYQWRLARRNGFGDSSSERRIEALCRKLPDLLPPLENKRASLVHGDLWGGNWMTGPDGRSWLIDPAVYFGHRETDLAMTRLFGGFPAGFHQGYENEWPLENGFADRVDIYNLYHLLNHLNLFGMSYWGGVSNTLSKYS